MRLIDADKVIEQFSQYRLIPAPKTDGEEAISDILMNAIYLQAEIVKNAPTIEAEPVKHGRWLIHNILDYAKRPTGRKVGECSVCGQLTPEFRLITEKPNWNYCPNCGARMDLTE